MIRIAICDDEPEWINIAHEIVEIFFEERSIENTIETFDNAQSLLKAAVALKEPFNILILDIDMPDINGFDAAEKLKELYPDMLLMFYTAHEQYVFDSFRFQPFRYIRKEHVNQELKPALLEAYRIIDLCRDKFVELKSSDNTFNIKVSDILYFETNKRKCDVHLKDGSILTVRQMIKALCTMIGGDNFVMVHSGAVVNIKYISCFSNFDVTLENGIRLPVSRPRSKGVKAAISEYWRKRI